MYIYTIIGSEIGYIGGNYKNDKPLLAANKAGKALFKKLEDIKYVKYKNKKSIKFVLKNKKDKINYCYEVFKKKNKKEFNYEIKKCVLSKNQLKKYTGGVNTPTSSAASSAQTQSDLGTTVREFSPDTINDTVSSPNPGLVAAAIAFGEGSDSGPLQNGDPFQHVDQRLLGSEPPFSEVGESESDSRSDSQSDSRSDSEPPSQAVQSRGITPENPSPLNLSNVGSEQSREGTPVNPSPGNRSPENLSDTGSRHSFPPSSTGTNNSKRGRTDNDDNDGNNPKLYKAGGNKIIKLLLSALPILQQNEIRTKYNIPKSHNSVDIILKNHNLKYKEETRKSTKNSIYYNIKIKDGKSKKYKPYSDKLNSKYFKLDISKK